MNIDLGVNFNVVNSEGKDLLNQDNDNAFNLAEINLYSLTNGKRILQKGGNFESPKYFSVVFEEKFDVYRRLLIFVEPHNATSNYEKLLIEWNPSTFDTLECNIKRTHGSTFLEKIWLNGVLLSENNWDEYGSYRLIK